MKKILLLAAVAFILLTSTYAQSSNNPDPFAPIETGNLLPGFDRPDKDYWPAMLWFWHDREMTPQVIESQLEEMKKAGFRDVMLFPLRSEPQWYTESWFKAIENVLRTAADKQMYIWLFNDNHVPSGRGANYIVKGGKLGEREIAARPDLQPMKLMHSVVNINESGTVNLLKKWPASGSPQPQTKIINGRLNIAVTPVLYNKGFDWTDHNIRMEVSPRDADNKQAKPGIYRQSGVLFRAKDENNYYQWLFSTYPYRGKGSYLVRMIIQNGEIKLFNPVKLALDLSAKDQFEIEIKLAGNRITTLIEGKEVDEFVNDTYTSGTFGFRGDGIEQAMYDNISVISPGGEVLYEQDFSDNKSLKDFAPRIDSSQVIVVSAIPVENGTSQLDKAVDVTDSFHKNIPFNTNDKPWQIVYAAADYIENLAGVSHLDILNPEATELFIDVIHEELKRRYPWAVGKTLRGIWDDEPAIPQGHGYVTWSKSFPKRFKSYGRDIARVLPAIFEDYGRSGQIERAFYYRALNDGWADWYRMQAKWLDDNGMLFISNPVNDHLGPSAYSLGGNMAKNNQYVSAPGVDAIFEQVMPGKNSMIGRWASSSAYQNGHKFAHYEIFGGYGWWVAPRHVRYVVGSVGLKGCNLCVYHAYWSNPDTVGYAPPFDPSNPWWHAIEDISEWAARVHLLISGEPLRSTALFVPTRSSQAFENSNKANQVEREFQKTYFLLEQNQVDFDLLDESILDGDEYINRESVAVKGGTAVGEQTYSLIIVPPVPAMSLEAAQTLSRHAQNGGQVIFYGKLPEMETLGRKGRLMDVLKKMVNSDKGKTAALCVDEDNFIEKICLAGAKALETVPYNKNILVFNTLHNNNKTCVIMNTSEQSYEGVLKFEDMGMPLICDPDTGKINRCLQYRVSNSRVSMPVKVSPFKVIAILFDSSKDPKSEPHVESFEPEIISLEVLPNKKLKCTYKADKDGTFEIKALYNGRPCRAKVVIDERFEVIKIDRNWQLQFEDGQVHIIDRPVPFSTIKPDYSGTVSYSCRFSIDKSLLQEGRQWLLDLSSAAEVAEIYLNEKKIASLIWPPYSVDVTGHLMQDNCLEVKVTNTLENKNGKPISSGLKETPFLKYYTVKNAVLGVQVQP